MTGSAAAGVSTRAAGRATTAGAEARRAGADRVLGSVLRAIRMEIATADRQTATEALRSGTRLASSDRSCPATLGGRIGTGEVVISSPGVRVRRGPGLGVAGPAVVEYQGGS